MSCIRCHNRSSMAELSNATRDPTICNRCWNEWLLTKIWYILNHNQSLNYSDNNDIYMKAYTMWANGEWTE